MSQRFTAPWSKENTPYVIAEIGSNHDGDKARALELIKKSAGAGANAVKFQLFKAEKLVLPDHPAFATLARLSTPLEWLPELSTACHEAGIHFSATAFDLEAVQALAAIEPAFIKIASSDITFVSLLRSCATTQLPILLSTGMSTYEDVAEALSSLKDAGAGQVALLHCVSMYPPQFSHMNLLSIPEMKEKFGCPVGLSDHTPGSTMAVVSATLGGMIIEKHVTDDKTRKGPDHPYALDFEEFELLVGDLKNTAVSLGNSDKGPQGDESAISVKARRGLYAVRDMEAGQIINETDLIALRPTAHINAEQVDQVIGKQLSQSLAAGSPLPGSILKITRE